jgi:hypothetical protein
MAGRLASPRFRRRLAWTVGLAGGTTGVVLGAIALGGESHPAASKIDRSKPAWVYRAPAAMQLTKQDRLRLYVTAERFVATAVRREHLDSAWAMLAPEMRAGQTRKSWDTGFNNVVPFKADGIQSWTILYSYDNDVALDLSLFHRGATTDNWAGKTFTIELKRYPSNPKRWLVASWVPKGIGGGGTLNPNRRAGPLPPPVKPHVSAKYLLVPALLLGTILLVLGAWGVHNVVRGRRASRRYAEALGYSESSNPS